MKTVEKSENSVPNAAGSRYAPLASPFQTFPEDCDEQVRKAILLPMREPKQNKNVDWLIFGSFLEIVDEDPKRP